MKKFITFSIICFAIVCKIAAQDADITALTAQLKGAKTSTEKFDATRRICGYYRAQHNNDSFKFFSQRLFDFAQAERNDSFLVVASNNVAVYFNGTGDYAQALQYHFKALNLAEKNGYYIQVGRLNVNIGWVYDLLGNYEKAIVFCKKAIPLLLPRPDGQQYLVAAYDNIAIAYIELKQPDSALHYTQLANTLNLTAKNTYEQSYIYYQFARIYRLLSDNELAESYFKKSISYSTVHNNLEALSIAATHFCRMLLAQNRIAEAKEYGNLGMNAALKSGRIRQAIDNAEVLRALFHQQKQTDSAYYYSTLVNVYRDSVFNEQKNLQLQNVIFFQQLHEKEMAQVAEEQAIQRKHNLQYAAIALAVVTLVILFFLFSHSIVANQRLIKFLGVLALLIVFEFLNLWLHPFIGQLTHHSPVLMLGIMVCLAALLIPLHHKLEHWITHKMVEKNNRIRLAAAKKTIAQLEGELMSK